MATRTLTKTGFMSDPTIYSGAAIPVDGDTIQFQGFTLWADYSLTGSGITISNTATAPSYLAPVNGNIIVNIAGTSTLTGKVYAQGSPGSIEYLSSNTFHATGIGH